MDSLLNSDSVAWAAWITGICQGVGLLITFLFHGKLNRIEYEKQRQENTDLVSKQPVDIDKEENSEELSINAY